MVTGPAGAGKTTALSELFGKIDLDETIASWLSLDEGDNDSLTFWDAFITALSENGGLGAGALSVLRFPEGAPIESVLTALINEVAQAPRKIVIILDDYQVIKDPAIHLELEFLIEHMPPKMHLMISSRQEPPLSLRRLRARGQLTEVSATHLRFTEEEATGFLNDSMGLALASNQILTLAERTEGWIAGLQMAALSIRDRDPDRFIAAFTGSNRYVGDYLTEEVLASQSAETMEFLERTAVVDRLTGPLCDALTGRSDSEIVLRRLEQANLFVVALDDQRQWYRYHQLFRDALLERLRHSNVGVQELHRLAARWFGENNSIPEALNHALRASDYPAACDLLEVAAYRLFDQGDIRTLLNWLKALPEEEIRSRPVLLSHCAWSLALNGRYDEAEQRLRQSGEAIESLPNDPSPRAEGLPLQRRVRCSLQALRSHLARARGDPDSTIKHARLAEADLDENDVRMKGVLAINLASAHWMKLDLPTAASTFAEAARHSQEAGHAHVTIMAIGLQAKALMILGRLSEARRVCDRAVEIASSQGMERIPGAGYAYVVLGDLLYERNELNEALERISLGMELYRQSGAANGLGDAYAAYARVLHALSDHDAVAEVLDEIEAVSEQGQFVPGECLIWPVLAKISLAEGDQRRAQGWLKQLASLSGADARQVDQLVQEESSKGEPYPLSGVVSTLVLEGVSASLLHVP